MTQADVLVYVVYLIMLDFMEPKLPKVHTILQMLDVLFGTHRLGDHSFETFPCFFRRHIDHVPTRSI